MDFIDLAHLLEIMWVDPVVEVTQDIPQVKPEVLERQTQVAVVDHQPIQVKVLEELVDLALL